MGEAVPPLTQYAFVAWFSVKRSTGTTLSLRLPFYYIKEVEMDGTGDTDAGSVKCISNFGLKTSREETIWEI
jgi:hypothetical protein